MGTKRLNISGPATSGSVKLKEIPLTNEAPFTSGREENGGIFS